MTIKTPDHSAHVSGSGTANATRLRIITNPGSNIDESIVKHYGLVILPQKICVDDVDYDTRSKPTGVEIDGWVKRAKRHPYVVGTSATEFVKHFQDALTPNEPLLVVNSSRKIITSHDSAVDAVQTLKKMSVATLPRIDIVDSRSTDIGAGMVVLLACQARAHGLSVDRIVSLLEFAAVTQVTVGTVERFDYLVKGKRASFLRAWLGDMLKQRPMISFVDGVLKSVSRYSTHDDPTEQTAKFYQERLPGKRRVWVAIAHGDDAHSAERLLAHLKTAFDVKYAYVRPLSASIYLHCGRGALFSSVLPLEPLPWQPPPLTLANALNK